APQRVDDGVIGIVGTAALHAVPVEMGSKPHFPPIQPLEDWAHHKLDLPAEEARGAAFAIARKIAAKGTEGAHMVERAKDANA
ncbi:hypothetical protein, partial [Tritonibacter sp. SIMBA_163]|uniref:hypothetical protein n=1 Tax=Tritonibacter sp. SIMBA_163 TaxID=3080868 RepID=UPI0039807BE9